VSYDGEEHACHMRRRIHVCHRALCRFSIPRVPKGFFKVTPLGLDSRAVERRI
jgi:hypothetical protein